MDKSDELKSALRGPSTAARPSRRERRAARVRARGPALSLRKVLLSLLAIPVITASLTISIYIRTSPYEPADALRHLIAKTGCEAAFRVGLAPARRGEMGYHARNDLDGDGVACGSGVVADARPAGGPAGAPSVRSVGGAKFLRP